MGSDLPDGYHTIMPYFTVENADKLVDFLVQAFDGAVLIVNRHPDDTIQHAKVRIGDSVVMLNQSSPDYPANVSQMHLYVDNADTAFTRCLALGGTEIMKPNTRPHGDRMSGIKDPCGNIWWLATPA